jgi:hypothetical protein
MGLLVQATPSVEPIKTVEAVAAVTPEAPSRKALIKKIAIAAIATVVAGAALYAAKQHSGAADIGAMVDLTSFPAQPTGSTLPANLTDVVFKTNSKPFQESVALFNTAKDFSVDALASLYYDVTLASIVNGQNKLVAKAIDMMKEHGSVATAAVANAIRTYVAAPVVGFLASTHRNAPVSSFNQTALYQTANICTDADAFGEKFQAGVQQLQDNAMEDLSTLADIGMSMGQRVQEMERAAANGLWKVAQGVQSCASSLRSGYGKVMKAAGVVEYRPLQSKR